MRGRGPLRRLAFGCGLGALLALGADPARGQTYDFDAAAAWLEANLDAFDGNVSVQVFQGDVEVFTFRGPGGLGPESQLRLGSATKWLSSAVVLRLADAGLLDLDGRIGDALPLFDDHGKGDVTLRQGFAMSSGLHEKEVDAETAPFVTLAQSVDWIAANTPLVFEPGTQLDYEGDGMQVVGRIAEVAAGAGWRTLAEQQLATPLGLDSLDYFLFPVNPAIAGGARASAEDYQRFLRMVLLGGLAEDGSRYLEPATFREWFSDPTLGLPEYFSPWPPYAYPYGERPDYGFGSWVLARDPQSGRVEEVSSPGVFGTFPWVDLRRHLRGVVAHDSMNGFADTLYVDLVLLDLLRAAIDEVLIFRDGFDLGDLAAWEPPAP
jgi:CubicO group peptidase (beta-lactamase class C family)